MDKKTLVISDVHNRCEKNLNLINKVSPDKIILLGDIFDQHEDTPKDVEKSAKFIRELIHNFGDNLTWCIGNHDVPYLFPALSYSCGCPGWNPEKMRVVMPVLNSFDFKKNITFLCKRNNIWFSHAGLSEHHFSDPIKGMDDELILKQNDSLVKKSLSGLADLSLMMQNRHPTGGITWQRHYQKDIIKGFNEVYGHTPDNFPHYVELTDESKEPVYKLINGTETEIKIEDSKTFNIDLDCFNWYYGILSKDILSIHFDG